MAYQVPLRYIQVGEDLAICATRIVAIMSVAALQARNLLRDERTNKTLINGCGRDAAKTAIILDNGSVVSSPFSIGVLLARIEKANYKNVRRAHITETDAAYEFEEESEEEDNAYEMGTDLDEEEEVSV